MKKNVQVHFWIPYPSNVAPSQRFRVELYLDSLQQYNIDYKLCAFLDQAAWDVLYKRGKLLKAWGTFKGFLRRTIHLFQSVSADYIFLHREAAPIGPPIFEWLLIKVFRKRVIHEYDDAIWIPGGENMRGMKKLLKATWKVKYIIKWSYKIVAGNDFLADYARKYNSNVIVIPTVVDTNNGHHKTKDQTDDKRIVVGWTGSHSTLHNLEEIEDVIYELKKEMDFDFLIISNKMPRFKYEFIFKKWEEPTELEDLLQMHIGVMPLKRGPWFEGKCGFKLIQYLACGIPAIASPVGVNEKIVLHEVNGFIAHNKEEWKAFIKKLIMDTPLRVQMAQKGRIHMIKEYSLTSSINAFVNLFK